MEEEITEKIILLGDISTGKTSFIIRFTTNEFETKTEPTIGCAFSKHSITLQNQPIILHIYDTSGDERFRSLTQMYFRGTKCVLLMIDVGNRDSLHSIDYWIGLSHSYISPTIPIILVATKSDLSSWQMTENDIKSIAKKHKLSYFITSSLLNKNVTETFTLAAQLAFRYDQQNDSSRSIQVLSEEDQKKLKNEFTRETISPNILLHSQYESSQPIQQKKSFFSFC